MDRLRSNSGMSWAIALAVLVFGIWSQHFAHSAAPGPAIDVKTVALNPTRIPVATADLRGHLEDLVVTTRVDTKTGRLIESPDLGATLRLQNTTEDQAIRLVSGAVEYVGASGAVIPLTKDQGTASFRFYPDYQDEVLPGRQAAQVIRVPFPVAALKANALRDIRLHLTYRATPYRNATAESAVTISG